MKETCKCREHTSKTKVKQKIIKIIMTPCKKRPNSWHSTSKDYPTIRWKYRKHYYKLNAPIKHCWRKSKKYKHCFWSRE